MLTKTILATLKVSKPLREIIKEFDTGYRTTIVNERFHLVDGKIVHLHPVDTTSKFISKIVVPPSLRRDIFLYSTLHIVLVILGNTKHSSYTLSVLLASYV